MEKKYYWLKLRKDFFKRHDITIIEAMPDGKEIVLLYIKLLVESLDHNGELRFNEACPYTPQMLSALFGSSMEVTESALSTLSNLGLIKIDEDRTIHLTKFEEFVGCETEMAMKKRIQRNLPTLRNGSKRLNGNTLVTPDGKTHTIDEKRYGGHGMQALDRAFGKCEVCGSDKDVLVHHNNGYSTEIDDLVCLCTSCHGKAHSKELGGHIDIDRPPYVHQLSTDCPPTVQKMSAQSKENRDKSKENRDKSKDIKKVGLSDVLEELAPDEKLKKAFADFIEMRKLIKKPLTPQALKLAIGKVSELSGGDVEKAVRIIDQSVLNNWQGLYPIKEDGESRSIHCGTNNNPYSIDWNQFTGGEAQ